MGHEHEQYQPMFDELRTLDGHVAQMVGAVQSLLTRQCLGTYTIVIPATGIACFSMHQEFGSVAITNYAAHAVTVTTDTAQGSAPTNGPGVGVVAAGKGTVLNFRGSALTIYGTAGDQITIQVFAGPSAPAWG